MKKHNILYEMFAGMILWGIFVQIILLCIWENCLNNSIGLWAGVVIAGGLAMHMKITIEDAVDIGGEYTNKKVRADIAKRYAVTGIVIAILLYFHIGNPLTLLAGLFALKISAYLQPFVHKVFQKNEQGRLDM